MFKKIMISLMIYSSTFVMADITQCGKAKIQGVVKELEKGKLFVVVNENTKSELILSTDKLLEPKLIPYENKPVKSVAKINKMSGATKGHINEIEEIEMRVPNPLGGIEDTFVTITKKNGCEK